jgi:hypothetical protein
VESVETCDIEDDTCEAKCPPGYVMPRGQDNQMFLCGMSTNYEWLPFNRLPICTGKKNVQIERQLNFSVSKDFFELLINGI